MVSVFFSEGPLAGELRRLDREVTIGREGCDVTLGDHQVSRRHLLLRPVGDALHVEDLGSSNGTFVNGYRITEAVGANAGDAIRIGTSELVVQVTTAPPPPSMPHPVVGGNGGPSAGGWSAPWIVAGVLEAAVIATALGFLVSYALG